MRRRYHGRSQKIKSDETRDSCGPTQTGDRCPYRDYYNSKCGAFAKHESRFCVQHHKQLQDLWGAYKGDEEQFNSIEFHWLDLVALTFKICAGRNAVLGRTEVACAFYHEDADDPGHGQHCKHDNKRHSEYTHDDKRAQYSGCDRCWRHKNYVKHTNWIQQLQDQVDYLQDEFDKAMSYYSNLTWLLLYNPNFSRVTVMSSAPCLPYCVRV
ncbi:hypothetical protein EDB81DRAFT_861537 [Dactylonectria macrodidyma]|uniref:Uncharacterized protein n=1 Tax=Dactylonectria macrodidyma TaxID=307937 RepID=A0A9P9IJE7_9HYPO|nr:hypothetical protein EDB81DRAFT_861537 [Dactylonectria macrodidyma]